MFLVFHFFFILHVNLQNIGEGSSLRRLIKHGLTYKKKTAYTICGRGQPPLCSAATVIGKYCARKQRYLIKWLRGGENLEKDFF